MRYCILPIKHSHSYYAVFADEYAQQMYLYTLPSIKGLEH